jgi:hypothetical protein
MKGRYGLALAACLVGGCGGSTTTGPPPPVSEDALPMALAHAVCDNIGRCCRQAGYAYGTRCIPNVLASLDLPSHVKFDPRRAGACVADTASLAKNCEVDEAAWLELLAKCSAAFTGTEAPGQPCQSSWDCAAVPGKGVFCSANGMCVAVKRRAHAGAACLDTCELDDGSVVRCVDSSGKPPTSEAGACFTNDGLYCSTDTQCARFVGVGYDCLEAPCAADAYCDPNTHRCEAYVPSGGACSSGQVCSPNGACGFYTHTCEPPLLNGENCTLDSECASGQCTHDAYGGVCTSLWATSDLCTDVDAGGSANP